MILNTFVKIGICLFFALNVTNAAEQADNISINIIKSHYKEPSRMEIGVEYADHGFKEFSFPVVAEHEGEELFSFPKGNLKKITFLWLNDAATTNISPPTMLGALTLSEIKNAHSLDSISLECSYLKIKAILGYNTAENTPD